MGEKSQKIKKIYFFLRGGGGGVNISCVSKVSNPFWVKTIRTQRAVFGLDLSTEICCEMMPF